MWSMVSNVADRSKRVRAVTDPLAIDPLENVIVDIKESIFS